MSDPYELSDLGQGEVRPVGETLDSTGSLGEDNLQLILGEMRMKREAAQKLAATVAPSYQNSLRGGIASVLAGLIGGGLAGPEAAGAMDEAESTVRGLEQEAYAAQLDKYNKTIKPALDYLKMRQDLSDKIMNTLNTNPDALAGMDPALLAELGSMGTMKIDPGAKSNKTAQRLRMQQQLQDVNMQIREIDQSSEEGRARMAELMNVKTRLISQGKPFEDWAKEVGSTTANSLRKNKLPPFATVVKNWGKGGAEAWLQSDRTGDISIFEEYISGADIIASPGRKQTDRVRIAHTIGQIKDAAAENEGVILSDAQAIERLPSGDQLLARQYGYDKDPTSLSQGRAAFSQAVSIMARDEATRGTMYMPDGSLTQEASATAYHLAVDIMKTSERLARESSERIKQEKTSISIVPPQALPPRGSAERPLQTTAAKAKTVDDMSEAEAGRDGLKMLQQPPYNLRADEARNAWERITNGTDIVDAVNTELRKRK